MRAHPPHPVYGLPAVPPIRIRATRMQILTGARRDTQTATRSGHAANPNPMSPPRAAACPPGAEGTRRWRRGNPFGIGAHAQGRRWRLPPDPFPWRPRTGRPARAERHVRTVPGPWARGPGPLSPCRLEARHSDRSAAGFQKQRTCAPRDSMAAFPDASRGRPRRAGRPSSAHHLGPSIGHPFRYVPNQTALRASSLRLRGWMRMFTTTSMAFDTQTPKNPVHVVAHGPGRDAPRAAKGDEREEGRQGHLDRACAPATTWEVDGRDRPRQNGMVASGADATPRAGPSCRPTP